MHYVTRPADDDLLRSLLAGQMCYVLDTRQVGKSSLMVRAATHLRALNIHVVILELSGGGQQLTSEQWYNGLLFGIGEQLNLEEEWERFWDSHLTLGPVRRFFACLQYLLDNHCAGRLVLFLDEIDAVRGLPFSTDEFFAAIRESSNRKAFDSNAARLTFCLLGVANPTELISDPNMTPFNVGTRIVLRDFVLAEGLSLIQGLPGHDTGSDKLLFERVLYWTHGHPYLTQKLCQALAEQQAKTSREVDRICNALFLNQMALRDEDNLAFVHRRILADAENVGSLLLFYRRLHRARRPLQVLPADPDLQQLLLAGVVRLESAHSQTVVAIRNRIYRNVFNARWIREAMPQAEARKHRRALQLGFARASLLWMLFALAVGIGVWQQSVAQDKARQAETYKVDVTVQKNKGAADMAQADRKLAIKNSEIVQQQSKLASLNTSVQATKAVQENLAVKTQAVRSENNYIKQLLRDNRHTLKQARTDGLKARQEAEAAGEQRDSATAAALTVQSGQEAAALQYSLNAIETILGKGRQPSIPSQQAFFRTVTAGAYRIKRIRCPYSGNTQVSFSSDGNHESKYLVVSGNGPALVLYETQTWRKVQTLQVVPAGIVINGGITCARFALRAPVLVTAYLENTHLENKEACFQLWDVSPQDGKLHWQRAFRSLCAAEEVPPRACLSADGSRLITNGPGKLARVWNVADGTFQDLSGHKGPVKGVDFASDQKDYAHVGMTFGDRAGADQDQSLWFWNTTTGKRLYTYEAGIQKPDRQITAARFAHFVDLVFWGTHEGDVEAWMGPDRSDTMGRLFRRYHGGTAEITDICQTTNSYWLTASDIAGRTLVWYAPAYERPLLSLGPQGHEVTSVRFSETGRFLATASKDGYVDVWSLPQTWYVGGGGSINYLDFSPDGKYLIVPDGGADAKIWKTANGRIEHSDHCGELDGPGGSIRHTVFSPDGARVATSSSRGVVCIWKAPRMENKNDKGYISVPGHKSASTIYTVFFSPDGRSIVSAGQDGVLISDAETGRQLEWLSESDSLSAVFQRDGKHILVAGVDGATRLYDLRTHRCEVSYIVAGARGRNTHRYPWSAVFSPDETTVLTADGDGNAYLWHTRTGALKGVFHVSTSTVLSAQFSPDGKRILTTGVDGITRLWSIPVKSSQSIFEAQSPDFELPGNGTYMNTARFTPDGKQFAVAGNDGLVRMYPATLTEMRAKAHLILAAIPTEREEYKPQKTQNKQKKE